MGSFTLALHLYYLKYLSISRIIVNTFEKQVLPWVTKITDSDSIVEKELYNKLKYEKESLDLKLEKEREAKNRLQTEVIELEKKMESIELKYNNKLAEENIGNSISKETIDKFLVLIFEKGYTEDFIDVAIQLSKGDGWYERGAEPENIKYYYKIGLIEVGDSTSSSIDYVLTNIGVAIFNVLRVQK